MTGGFQFMKKFISCISFIESLQVIIRRALLTGFGNFPPRRELSTRVSQCGSCKLLTVKDELIKISNHFLNGRLGLPCVFDFSAFVCFGVRIHPCFLFEHLVYNFNYVLTIVYEIQKKLLFYMCLQPKLFSGRAVVFIW